MEHSEAELIRPQNKYHHHIASAFSPPGRMLRAAFIESLINHYLSRASANIYYALSVRLFSGCTRINRPQCVY
jgi:hypothetical protein